MQGFVNILSFPHKSRKNVNSRNNRSGNYRDMHTFDFREYVDSCRHYFTRGYHDTEIFSSEPQLKRTSNETKGVKYQFLPNMGQKQMLVPLEISNQPAGSTISVEHFIYRP